MKLLIVTQVVDKTDPVLGFFHRWIEEFAKNTESVQVICLKEGEHSLPKNVSVHSLGKEEGRRSKITYAMRFLGLAWKLRKNYDVVFVHMNTEYVALAGVLWKMLRKKVGLWYTHKAVTPSLRMATMLSDIQLTASAESFRLKSRRLHVMGHGVDVNQIPARTANAEQAHKLVCVGRIAPVKRIDLQIKAVSILNETAPYHLEVIGGPVTEEDALYKESLGALIKETDQTHRVALLGPMPHTKALERLHKASLFLHTSETGSLDKVLLEALAAGLSVVSTSTVLPDCPFIMRSEPSPIALAARIERAHAHSPEYGAQRKYVELEHGLPSLISRIMQHYAR